MSHTEYQFTFITHCPATGVEPLRGTRYVPFATDTRLRSATDGQAATATATATPLSPSDSLLKACQSIDKDRRRMAYAALPGAIAACTDPGYRDRLVLQLIRGAAKDELQQINRKRLCDLPPSFFNPEARYELSRLIDTTGPSTDRIILLCAHLGMQDLLPDFRQQLHASPPPPPRIKHALILSMARLNDRDALDKLLSFAGRMEPGDDLAYELAPELLFTRQPEALNFILDLILSEELSCSSPDPSSSRKIPCAFHLIELLGPLVEGFPLPPDSDGSIIYTSMDEALTKTREWIRTNRPGISFRPFDQLPLSRIL
ncbi:MAG: hypothetical protein U0T82_07725 [Bacteroidales bacterium]